MNNDGKRRVIWHRIVALLQCVVLLVTIYAMVLPALTMERVLACEQESHVHDSSCYEKVLTCTQEDGHVHTDACYTYESVLTCDIPEHTHSEECYDAEGNLVCEQQEHTHTDECYTNEQTLTCELPEGHVHTDACYKLELTCGKQEHAHSDNCYADRKADVEGASDWEDTLPEEEELNGEWPHDVVAVAESQLDYTESVANWQLSEDGQSRQGYTRYGAWFGAPYADWCAMFASFCLHYAGVPEEAISYNASCPGWVEELKQAKLFASPDADYIPQPGDLLFLNFDPADQEEIDEEETGEVAAERTAQHVAIVKELDEEHQVLYAYEGNSNNKVQLMAYLLPGYVEPTEEEQQDLPEEERFHTPEISMQLHEKSIVGYGSIELAKAEFDAKYPNGLNPEEGKTDNGISADNVINNVVDVNMSSVEDNAQEKAETANSILSDDTYTDTGKRFIFKVMLDGEWKTVGELPTEGMGGNNRAYVSTAKAEEILAPYGYHATDDSHNGYIFGHAFANEDYYTIASAIDHNKVIDASNGEIDQDGCKVQIWDASYAKQQIWKFEDAPSGCVSIRNLRNGRYIHIIGDRFLNGDKLHLWTGSGYIASTWKIERLDNGNYSFRSSGDDNRAIDLRGGSTENGKEIQVWEWNNSLAQQWYLRKTFIVYNDSGSDASRIYGGLEADNDYFIYYLPGADTELRTQDSPTVDSAGRSDLAPDLARYGFYTVEFRDNNGLMRTEYVRYGSSITVSDSAYVNGWTAVNRNGEIVAEGNQGDALSNIQQTLTVMPKNGTVVNKKVHLKVLVEDEWVTVGTLPFYYAAEEGFVAGGTRTYVTSEMVAQYLAPYGYDDPTVCPGYSFAIAMHDEEYCNIMYAAKPTMVVEGCGAGDANTNNIFQIQNYQGEYQQNLNPTQTFKLEHAGNREDKDCYLFKMNPRAGGDTERWINLHCPTGGLQHRIGWYGEGTGNADNLWYFEDVSGGTIIHNYNGTNRYGKDQVLDLDVGATTPGSLVHVWNTNGGDTQKWIIDKFSLIWNDCGYKRNGATWKIGCGTSGEQGRDFDLYYIPAHRDAPNVLADKGATSKKLKEDGSRFHAVTPLYSKNVPYSETELAELATAVIHGGSKTIRLKTSESGKYYWVAVAKDNSEAIASKIDGDYSVITLENVTKPYYLVLMESNPDFRVGYFGPVDKPLLTDFKEGDWSDNAKSGLSVWDTTGKSLPANGVNEHNKGITRIQHLQVDDNGYVLYTTLITQLYADRTFQLLSSPLLSNIDVMSNSNNYEIDKIQVFRGDVCVYDGSADNIQFTAKAANTGWRNGKLNILVTDDTYIKIIYRVREDDTIKIKTRFLDYDIMSPGQGQSRAWNEVHGNGGDNNYNNWGINDPRYMICYNGESVTQLGFNDRYAAQYLFGNTSFGVLNAGSYRQDGNLSDIGGWIHLDQGAGSADTDGSKKLYRLDAASFGNYRACLFGIAKPQLVWNGSDYELRLTDNIAYPDHMFDTVERDGKKILDNYNLVFARKGNTYTLRQVAGTNADDTGYMYKHGYWWDGANAGGEKNEVADLRRLWNPGYGSTLHQHIYTNNFWPMDMPAICGWDAFSGGKSYDGNGTIGDFIRTMQSDWPNNADQYCHDILSGEDGYTYEHRNGQFPVSDDGWAHNSLFGMTTQIDFDLAADYVGPLDYLFFGDDDMWVYLVNRETHESKLICDIGGTHSTAGNRVNLRDYLPVGSSGKYALKFFYTERGFSGSTCYMSFNLPEVGTSNEAQVTQATLSKHVEGDETDLNKSFEFTLKVMREDGSILDSNAVYPYAVVRNDGTLEQGDISGNSGTMTLHSDESITIFNLPEGEGNQIEFKETDSQGFDQSVSVSGRAPNEYTFENGAVRFELATGSDSTKNNVVFTNTKRVSASMTKRVASGGNTNKDFNFRIITWDPAWAGRSGDYRYVVRNASGAYVTEGKLTNGQANITLKHGQTVTVEDIPLHWHIGFYEIGDAAYNTSWEGTGGKSEEGNDGNDGLRGYVSNLDDSSVTYACTCTNTPITTTATLIKRVENAPSGEENHEYTFVFRYCPPGGDWVEDGRDYPYVIYDADGITQVGSGTLHYNSEFKLKAKQKIVVSNVVADYRIEFIERPDQNYYPYTASFTGKGLNHTPWSSSGNEAWGRSYIAQLTASENELICTNTYQTTSASLTKVVSGENIEPNKEFNFLVLIWNYAAFANGDWSGGWVSLDGSYPCTFTPSGNANRPQTVANRAMFSLKAGETITISGLPVGARISFYEEGYDGYATSWSSTGTNKRADGPLDHTNNWKGWIQQLEADANNNKFTCTNAVNTASATLTKVVTGANPGPTTSFSFITRIWKDTPNDMDGKTYRYTVKKASGGEESGTLGDEGRFTLGAGDTITVTGIPVGATVGFYEQSYSGYDTTWAGGTSGNSDGWLGRYQKLTTANETIQFTCTNDSQYADLVVGKKVYGQAITDINWRNEPFTFQICDGTYGRNDQEIAHHPYIGAGVEFDVYTLQSGDSDTGIDGSDAVYVKTGTRKTTSGGMFMLKHNEKAVFHNVLPGKVRVVERIIHDINPFYVHMSGDGGVAVTNENFGTETFGFTADGEDYYVSDAFDIKPNGQYTAGTASETKVRNRAMDCGLVVRKTVKTVGGDTSANGIYALQVLINGQPLKGACWITGAVDPDTGADLPGGNNLVHTLTKEDGTTIEGVIYIRPGRDINIWNLNNGASFQITEIDAGKAGYLPTYEVGGTAQTGSATGTVKLDPSVENSNRTSLVHITNAEQGCSVEIPVKKTISNPNGKESTYSFTAFCWSNGGSNVSTGLSNKQTITISTDNSANGNFTFGYLSKNFPEAKEYTLQYRIDELAGTEANMFYETGIHWDVTVYVTKNADGTISARVADTHKLNVDGADQGYVADSHLGQGGKYYDNVEFINTWYGNINLTKKLHDANGNEDTTSGKTFSFNAYFEKADGTRLTERERNCAQITLNGQSVTMNDQGEFTFALSHGQTVSMTMLPVGTKCIVTENESAYKVEVSTDNGGTFTEAKSLTAIVPANGTVNAIFKNSPTTNSASLTKKVSGQGADKGKEFEFQPVIWLGGEGEHQWDNQSGNYTYTLRSKNADGSYQYYKVTDEAGNYEQINTSDPQSIRLQFDYANGKCTSQIIKLKDNWTFTIYGLPDGVRVGFYEKATAGYAASWDCTTQTGYRPDNVQTFIGYGVLFDIAENRNNDGNINHVTCTNTTGTELPQTGGVGQGLFFGIGALLMCCAGYLLLRRKRRDVTA